MYPPALTLSSAVGSFQIRFTQNIFKAYDLNFYFDCLECDISKFNYYKVASILKNIELKHKTQPIDQMNLSQIFYTV